MAELDERIAQERAIWSSSPSDDAAWSARALVADVRKAGRTEEAIELGEEALHHLPDSPALASAVAWAYYERDLKGLDGTSPQAARAAAKASVDRIGQLTASDPYGPYSSWATAVLRLAKVLLDRWPRHALEQARRLDVTRLSSEASRDFPSATARWYLITTKALEELERWDELLEVCDQALRASGLRDDDRRWLQLRRGTGLTGLGRLAEATEVLLEFRRQQDAPWVDGRLAELYATANDPDTATTFARRALATAPNLAFGWKTVRLLHDLLQATDAPLASRHLQLARSLRAREGWPSDASLEQRSAADSLGRPDPAHIDLEGLRRWWRAAPDPDRQTGIVQRLLDHGGAGFITPDDGAADLYFSRPRSSTAPLPRPGTHVRFVVRRGFDKAKNKPSAQAHQVAPIEVEQ